MRIGGLAVIDAGGRIVGAIAPEDVEALVVSWPPGMEDLNDTENDEDYYDALRTIPMRLATGDLDQYVWRGRWCCFCAAPVPVLIVLRPRRYSCSYSYSYSYYYYY